MEELIEIRNSIQTGSKSPYHSLLASRPFNSDTNRTERPLTKSLVLFFFQNILDLQRSCRSFARQCSFKLRSTEATASCSHEPNIKRHSLNFRGAFGRRIEMARTFRRADLAGGDTIPGIFRGGTEDRRLLEADS